MWRGLMGQAAGEPTTAGSPPSGGQFMAIVPIYFGTERHLIDELSSFLEKMFALPVRVCPPWFDPERVFDPSRSQYNSTLLLAELLGDPHRAERILGVTSVDLFIPVLTYVFGEAQLEGRAAVVSTHRLRSEVYGLPADTELLRARLVKESAHELGHTYGLVHCRDATCVMRASTLADDIDLKSERFCPACWGAIAPQLK